MNYGNPNAMDGRVTLETAIGRMEGETLELFYRVTNGLECSILLMTPLPRVDVTTTRADPKRVYAYVDPDGILHLTKRLWPLPDALDVVFPEIPFATDVGPERHFEERIVLSLPIPINIPYALDLEEQEKRPEETIAVAGGIAFSIGYLVEEPLLLRKGPASPESGASLVVGYGTASENQRILQGGTLGIGVPVKELRR
jgi:hypothetical protein